MPTMTIERETTLHCTEGSSDKLYRVRIETDGAGSYNVHCSSCRRGSTWVDQGFKAQAVSAASAYDTADKVIRSKEKKGYFIQSTLGGSSPTTSTPSTARLAPAPKAPANDGRPRPQLLNAIEPEDVETYLSSPAFCMEPKMDGVRLMVRKEPSGAIAAWNRKGTPVALEGPVLEGLGSILGNDGFTLDGELVGDRYHVFDCLSAFTADLTGLGYLERRNELFALLTGCASDAIEIVPFTVDPQQKRDDLVWLRKTGAEGVVFKRLDAVHSPGRPNSGGDQLKFKFYETATVLCGGTAKDGKRSVQMLVLKAPDGHPRAASMPAKFRAEGAIPVGNVTIPPNADIPELGSLIEVRYLYAFESGSLYQPTFLCPRTDLVVEDCHAAQLKFKTPAEEDDAA